MMDTHYTVKDATNRVEPSVYLQKVIWHAKGANINSVENQLLWVYNNIDLEIKILIDSPTPQTTVAQIIQIFELKKEV